MKKVTLIFALLLVCSFARAADFFTSQLATHLLMQNLKLSASTEPQLEILDVQTQGGIDLVTAQLHSSDMPAAQLVLRGPAGFLQRTDYSYQALFIASGFFTGSSSVQLLGEIANTVVIGYEYPYSVQDMTRDPAKLLQTFRLTAGQIALSLKWLSLQAWANPQRTIAMGVSLGGLFLPTALHIAQEMNASVSHVIFGFTGADIKTILANNLRDQVPTDVANGLLATVPVINAVNDPQLHLPFLKGRFLVLQADQDQVIPAETTEKLFSLLPQPKEKVLLPGRHIDTTQTDLIALTKATILDWLH